MLRDDDRSENLYTAPITLPGSIQPADGDDAPDIDAEPISASIACSLGAKPPPPIPCSTLNSRRNSREGAMPHRKLLTVNKATHIM